MQLMRERISPHWKIEECYYLESVQVADLEDEARTGVTSLQANDLMVRHQDASVLDNWKAYPAFLTQRSDRKVLRA